MILIKVVRWRHFFIFVELVLNCHHYQNANDIHDTIHDTIANLIPAKSR
jgi:hypothetical protein